MLGEVADEHANDDNAIKHSANEPRSLSGRPYIETIRLTTLRSRSSSQRSSPIQASILGNIGWASNFIRFREWYLVTKDRMECLLKAGVEGLSGEKPKRRWKRLFRWVRALLG
jgi:hypothetical protein